MIRKFYNYLIKDKTIEEIKDKTIEESKFQPREEILLMHASKEKKGLEIGPSYNPIASKKNGYNVKIIDWADKDQLIKKYKKLGQNIDKIEEVDYIWTGEPISKLIPEKFDWIIASHVIEHAPDLVGFLNDYSNLLVNGGKLILAIPDKRFCFDAKRELSSLSKVIDSIGNKMPTKGTLAEYRLKRCKKNGLISWLSYQEGDVYEYVYTIKEAIQAMKEIEKGKYIDTHNWVFTPESFRNIINDLIKLEFINLKEINFFDTQGHEFFVTFEKVELKNNFLILIKMKKILITGGAGFVGSNLAIFIKESFEDVEIIVFDNLYRRGSELNFSKFKEFGIDFIHGDVRNASDLEDLPHFDLLIECSAEPSVMAVVEGSPDYLMKTNLMVSDNFVEI